MREGYLDLGGGLWQCEKTSKPFSSRRFLGRRKGWAYDGELKELTGKTKGGYYLIKINGKMELFHREIWKHFHGEIPNFMTVDHRDRNPQNNHISNLRLATRSQQIYNQSKRKDCSSIFKGVRFHKVNRKWQAYIRINGKQKTIGFFHIPCERMAAMAFDAYVEENNIPNCLTNKDLGLL